MVTTEPSREPIPPAVWYGASGFVVIASLIARALCYPLTTADYLLYGRPWFAVLQAKGFSAFASPFSDYTPSYLYLLKLVSLIPASSLYSIKTLSVTFDALLALITYKVLRSLAQPRRVAVLAGVLLFSAPTIVLNSSAWGQSDSIYASCILSSLYCMVGRKPFLATLMFALAFCLKLQAVFFAPVLAGYLLSERGKILYLLAIPAVFLGMLIPALLAGGQLSYWGLIYVQQASEYRWLSVHAPSLLIFFNDLSTSAAGSWLFCAGLIAALLAAGAVTLYVDLLKPSPADLVRISLICVLAIPYLLPRMHERYLYLADVLSVAYAFLTPRQWYIPVLVIGASLMSYMTYLSGQIPSFSAFSGIDLRLPAALLLVAVVLTVREAAASSGLAGRISRIWPSAR